jgi:hypothetical protein
MNKKQIAIFIGRDSVCGTTTSNAGCDQIDAVDVDLASSVARKLPVRKSLLVEGARSQQM